MTEAERGAWPTGIRPGSLERCPGLGGPGMKKHVRVLEEAQLVTTVKVGRTRLCHLGPRRLDDIQLWVETYRQMVNDQLDRFGTSSTARKETGSDRRSAESPRRQPHQAE